MPFPVDNIRRQCAIHGITLAELERELGFGNGVIARWETNKASPPYDRLKQIADRFGISVDDITKEENASALKLPLFPQSNPVDSGLYLPDPPHKKTASPQADGVIDKLIALNPELRDLFVRILAAAKEDPERVKRYLAFLVQELESQR